MTSEKDILQKLIKIAENQRKMLIKLASGPEEKHSPSSVVVDPNIEYLRRAAQVAAVNCSFNTTAVYVVADGNSYLVQVSGAPKNNAVRQKFIATLKNQVATQKPEQMDLAHNLVIKFAD